MDTMTLEQLLDYLPAFVYTPGNERLWLHLQPTYSHRTWNAFYAAIRPNRMLVHPFLSVEEPTARDALVSLGHALEMGKYSLEPDPQGYVEGIDTSR